MEGNIWKGKWKGNKGGMKEQLVTMMDDDEVEEYEVKLEKMSDLLQEDGGLNYDVEDHYTIFE